MTTNVERERIGELTVISTLPSLPAWYGRAGVTVVAAKPLSKARLTVTPVMEVGPAFLRMICVY
jgi:hypothetical protein